MKKLILGLGVLVGLLMLGGSEIPAAPVSPSIPSQIFMTAGGGLGTTTYAIAAGISPLLEKNLGVQVRATPIEVVRDRYKGLNDGSIHINLAAMGNACLAAEGVEAYADEGWGPKPYRIIWRFFNLEWGYVVTRDSDIKTIYDIKGRRVALGMHSSAVIGMTNSLLAFVNLKREDVKTVPFGSWAACVRALAERKVDVTTVAAESGLTYELESSPAGIRFLDLPPDDKAAWARYLKHSPTASPVKFFKGVKSAQGYHGFSGAHCWVVTPSASDEFAYRLAKFAGENYDTYKTIHKALDFGEATHQGQRTYLDTCGFVVHPGAIRYMKEIGLWTARDEKRNNENIALEKRFEQAWKAAVADAKSKDIEVRVKNKAWMDIWESHRANLPRIGTRIE